MQSTKGITDADLVYLMTLDWKPGSVSAEELRRKVIKALENKDNPKGDAAGKGTGLGLSMVAGILKSHGGFVQVESELGRGSTFHLFFPAIAESTPTARDEAPAPARGWRSTIGSLDNWFIHLATIRQARRVRPAAGRPGAR